MGFMVKDLLNFYLFIHWNSKKNYKFFNQDYHQGLLINPLSPIPSINPLYDRKIVKPLDFMHEFYAWRFKDTEKHVFENVIKAPKTHPHLSCTETI